jgi:cardiolipin synthase
MHRTPIARWTEQAASLIQSGPREILRFQSDHRVELFHRGRDTLESMLEAIDSAREHVHLETYILRSDETGRRILDALEARARDGVSVRIIFDAVGSYRLDRQALAGLSRAGAEFLRFNPPSRWLWRFKPRQRDHRKILLVDGRIGFLGGMNIGDEYVHEDQNGPTWRDAHVRLEGPALVELQALFLENWFRSGGESFDWRSLVAGSSEVDGDRSVAILADGPMYRRRRLRRFFLDELQRAESHVLLVSPYFAPGSRVLDALEAASERGVLVELLLAGHSDHPLLRRAVREFIPRLLKHGVKVYEDPRRMMHAKLAVFDDSLAVLGTSNLDRQSLDHSCEVNAVFDGQQTSKWILEHFGTDVHEVVPIDQDTLARRRPWTRWVDRAAAFWARL